MTLRVAIVGRPNVGKSTLFNRLIGKKLAIVDNNPGVTRDRRVGDADLWGLKFTLIDTAGYEETPNGHLQSAMQQQTQLALDESDIAMMLVDARTGILPIDRAFAKVMHRQSRLTILLANKCEGAAAEAGLLEAFSLGLGDPIAFSAEHGLGLKPLYDKLRSAMAQISHSKHQLEDADETSQAYENYASDPTRAMADSSPQNPQNNPPPQQKPIQLAIVGRPNVGKSSLVNKLLGEERMLTGAEAGITRDAIALDFAWRGQQIRLVDTAGLRRQARIDGKIESLAAAESRRAIKYAQIVVLVLDADDMLEKQDLSIARHIVEEGRAMVLVVNKWDLVQNPKRSLRQLSDRLQTSLAQIKGVPVVTVSALTGYNLDKMMDAVGEIYQKWNRRIPTSRLNNWLAGVTAHHPPPLAAGRRIKLRYITQARNRPPGFALFASLPEKLPESYLRYLENTMRQDFDLWGIPLRLMIRKGHNPYAKNT